MFKRILIANRGEIACRVMRTAARMGVETVAVYSDADRRSLHVEMADAAFCIGPTAAVDSYLNIDSVLKAAHESGTEAIHPGYGFLSENADFAKAVTDAGMVFIGPSPQAIELMGQKNSAKAAMEAAGVPVVPGYHGSDQTDDILTKAAEAIGYPVMIKAAAGGGGKGMRAVADPSEFADRLASARNEAKAAFGDDVVILEKLISNPRHIEIQIFGDGKSAVHLFERDCSLQRRHQKIIEEAPAPGMPDSVRQAMGAAAIRAAEAVGYAGAGTIEFIADGSDGLREDRFWFLEMNTRLQVEHPVTEEITGLDLVEWQLRIAAGEDIPLAQSEISVNGHAIEARLYAEDPQNDFLPSAGRLEYLKFPTTARIETGVRGGDTVSPAYDPMFAKIVVKGATREDALTRLDRSLAESSVVGIPSNLEFLSRLIRLPEFQNGVATTGSVGAAIDALVAGAAPPSEFVALAAAALFPPQPNPVSGFSLWSPNGHRVGLTVEGQSFDCRLFADGPGRTNVRIEETEHSVCCFEGRWQVDGNTTRVELIADNCAKVFGDEAWSFFRADLLAASSADTAQSSVIAAPLTGLLKKVTVAVGEDVTSGQTLAILEAMKMEHLLQSPRDGRVAELGTSNGDQVTQGTMIIRLEDAS